jgi:hypothetical protein
MENIFSTLADSSKNLLRVFLELVKFISPFVIALILYFGIKIIYRYYKYGYKEFNFVKKPNSVNYKQELLFFMLEKIEGYRKIIVLNELNSNVVIIDKTGIYLVYIYNHDGVIIGNYDDQNLVVKASKKERTKLENPYKKIEEDMNLLQDKFPISDLRPNIIINNTCILDVKYQGLIQKIYVKEFFYKFDLAFKKNPKIYDKETIDKYYKLLRNGVK